MKSYFQWIAFCPTDLVCRVATLGPLGFWGRAPGTNGSVLGLLWYTVVFYPLGGLSFALLFFLSLYLAIAFCGEAEIRMAKKDPGCIILDEFVAIPVCFIGIQSMVTHYPTWLIMLGGLVLFRGFDILKPFGIRKLQNLPQGFGVVIDDVGAAVATCVCLHVAVHLSSLFIKGNPWG